MDKFTITTENDISNMNLVEEETPQKNRTAQVIAIIISILLSVAIWLYVMETDETKIEKEYEQVTVNIVNSNEQFNITAQDVDVILIGTNSQLVDIEKSDIIVEIDSSEIKEAGDYSVVAKTVYVNDNMAVEVKNQNSFYVKVHVEAK